MEATHTATIYASFWGANRNKVVHIREIQEFGSPRLLETIPFPEGVEDFADLPQSFIDGCHAKAAALAGA